MSAEVRVNPDETVDIIDEDPANFSLGFIGDDPKSLTPFIGVHFDSLDDFEAFLIRGFNAARTHRRTT